MSTQYLTIKEIAERATLTVESDLVVVITDTQLNLVDSLGKVVISKSFVDNSQHLVERLPFEYYSNSKHGDEDYDIEMHEYLNDDLVPDCVNIDGIVILLEL